MPNTEYGARRPEHVDAERRSEPETRAVPHRPLPTLRTGLGRVGELPTRERVALSLMLRPEREAVDR